MSNELLKMIETVDPNDIVKLDEIDARVQLYAACIKSVREGIKDMDKWIYTRKKYQDCPQYTRSRDALKSIRPEGWGIQIIQEHFQDWATKKITRPWFCTIRKHDVVAFGQFSLPTEELAELHAIIQAITYERSSA